MLTLHIPTVRSPVEGLSHQTLGTQHLLPPLWALAVPSAGLVQSVRCWPGHQELWLLGLSSPWPLERAIPFPSYRTRQLQDSSRVLSSPVAPGSPCCS